jgi:hypothetical protein
MSNEAKACIFLHALEKAFDNERLDLKIGQHLKILLQRNKNSVFSLL